MKEWLERYHDNTGEGFGIEDGDILTYEDEAGSHYATAKGDGALSMEYDWSLGEVLAKGKELPEDTQFKLSAFSLCKRLREAGLLTGRSLANYAEKHIDEVKELLDELLKESIKWFEYLFNCPIAFALANESNLLSSFVMFFRTDTGEELFHITHLKNFFTELVMALDGATMIWELKWFVTRLFGQHKGGAIK